MPVIGGLFGHPTTGGDGSGEWGLEAGEDLVEEVMPAGLVSFGGVVSLAEEDGDELGAGLEVDAGLADGLEAAVEFDGPAAVAVAEQSPLLLLADAELGGVLLVAGQSPGLHVEGVDLVGDRLIFLGDGAVGDAGVAHGHAQGA